MGRLDKEEGHRQETPICGGFPQRIGFIGATRHNPVYTVLPVPRSP
jgi:hypothetical protein